MDERNYTQPRRAEPGFEDHAPFDALSAVHANAPAPPVPYPEAGDMPAWLKDPVPSSGGWKRSAALWTGALAALALVFAGSMWLFEEHKADSTMGVVAMSSGAAAPATPAAAAGAQAGPEPAPWPAERPKASKLPPLVLLEPAPPKVAKAQDESDIIQPLEPVTPAAAPALAAKTADAVQPPAARMAPPPSAAPAAVAAVVNDAPKVTAGVTKLAPKTAVPLSDEPAKTAGAKDSPAVAALPAIASPPTANEVVRAEPVIAKLPPAEQRPAARSGAVKAPPAKPLVALAAPKPAPPAPAAKTPVQRKSLAARNGAPKGSAKSATSKKPPANRNGTLLAKAKPRDIAGVTLRPVRELRDDEVREPEQPRSRPPLPGRCQPGELARECSARLGLR